jgi:multicomponent Na+:H+ antiporter subunit G
MDAALVFDAARLAIGGLAVAAGLALMAGGAIGLLRFPDFYTRLHAAGASDGPGAALVLIGLATVADSGGVALRLVLLAALWVAVAPTLTHLTASAAHAAGLAPLTGRYAAPRPVARKDAQP